MIHQDKNQSALRALNSILTRARWMAHESNSPRLADLLDAAEILPIYLAQPENTTEEFRAVVKDISEEFEECSHVIEDFNQDCAYGAS
jgi:hypothetical protein